MGSWSIWDWWSVFAFAQHLHLLGQTDDRTSTAHLSPHLLMDYLLKLQGHTSMSNLIGMPWLYFVVLAWWFNVIILSAGSSAQQLQHFFTTTMLQNCITCGWRGTLFLGQIWNLNSRFDPKISLWPENKEAWLGDDDGSECESEDEQYEEGSLTRRTTKELCSPRVMYCAMYKRRPVSHQAGYYWTVSPL